MLFAGDESGSIALHALIILILTVGFLSFSNASFSIGSAGLPAFSPIIISTYAAISREMAAYVLMMMGEKAGKPALPMLKEALEKERNPTVKINIINAWSAIDPDSSPANNTPRQP